MPKLLLAADIGGTKIDMGLFELVGGVPKPVRISTVPTSSYGSAGGAFDTFLLADAPWVAAACVGVAGPVVDGRVDAPNIPWPVTVEGLKHSLEIENVRVINDLVATAWGVSVVGEENLVTLQEGGEVAGGTRALIAPGTGLGEALMVARDGGYEPLPSEGGHADFAPVDELQIELLRHLREKGLGHVSYEAVGSGPGLKVIYDFLVATGIHPGLTATAEKFCLMDHAAVVCQEGLTGRDPACEAAIDLYLAILGAEAGNLALKSLCTGGLYIGGGVAPRLMPKLTNGPFLASFRSKGRMSPLMERIPVRLMTEARTALLGAALVAASMGRG